MTTPADRYASFRERQADPEFASFRALYDFAFDDFQVAACGALSAGHGVLVAAPTGSGKTVVGEFAVHLALAEGRKCFYTTPIKALSNQKYADLVRRYDSQTVGLLTGDNSINSGAPVVVMTTEVLRNMLYTGSTALAGLGYVVLDEVHYLADRSRGAGWGGGIIHLPESVRVVALSATVSNAEEFGEWLDQVRGGTSVIVDEHRPVPLWQHVLAGNRLYDLFTDTVPTAGSAGDGHPRVNPELLRVAQRDTWIERKAPGRPGRGGSTGRRPRRFPLSYRPDVIARLDASGLLPAITFIFSRAGCCPRRRRPRPSSGPPSAVPPTSRRRTWPSWATANGWTGCGGGSRRITPGCCPPSRKWWKNCSRPGWSARCSRPRRSLSASTCRPGPWSSRSWTSGTARPTRT